ncbi:MAG TPA: CoA transferase, partial [Vineibacter sp.]|nr:CoA transferase [Vineibacter sp.]
AEGRSARRHRRRTVALRAVLEPRLGAAFARETCKHLLARLIPDSVPFAPAKKVSDMLADPYAIARQSVVAMDFPGLATIMAANNPLRLFGAPVDARRMGLWLGEYTLDVLRRWSTATAQSTR